MFRLWMPAALALAAATAAHAQPGGLPADRLKALKAATVFVKVGVNGYNSSGSGFVVHAGKGYGLVVTNDHVVTPPASLAVNRSPFSVNPFPRDTPPVIRVVFHSGTAAEWAADAEVVYKDWEADLALLRVTAAKPIPDPLPLAGADRVPETTPVFVCGFPFGEALAEGAKNPELSIGAASVSSNRTDDKGEVATVQLNGAVNPGNSGGPVVTQDGKLVGVAVSAIRGAGLGFAVPAAKVRAVVKDVHATPPAVTVEGTPPKLRVAFTVTDAHDLLKVLEVQVAAAPDRQPPERVYELPKAVWVKPTAAGDGKYTAALPVPDGSHFWYQLRMTFADGKSYLLPAVRVARRAAEGGHTVFSALGRDRGHDGLTGNLNEELPPVATLLGPPPAGVADVADLDRRAAEVVGKEFTTDILSVGVDKWHHVRDGALLTAFDGDGGGLAKLQFVLDHAVRSKLDAAGVKQCRLAFRARGKVRYGGDANRLQFVVEDLSLLDLTGKPVTTFRREAAAKEYAAPLPGQKSPVDVAAERNFYKSLLDSPHDRVNGRVEYTLLVTEVRDETVSVGGKPVPLKRLVAKNLLGEPLDALKLYVRPETGAKIAKVLPAGGPGLSARLKYRMVRYERKAFLCSVTEFRSDDGLFGDDGPELLPPGAKYDSRAQEQADREADAQAENLRMLRTDPAGRIGMTTTFRLVVTGLTDVVLKTGKWDQTFPMLSVADADGVPITDLKFYLRPEHGQRLRDFLRDVGKDRHLMKVTFAARRIDPATKAVECAVSGLAAVDETRFVAWIANDHRSPDLSGYERDEEEKKKALIPLVIEQPLPERDTTTRDAVMWAIVAAILAGCGALAWFGLRTPAKRPTKRGRGRAVARRDLDDDERPRRRR
jgi:S1-C subfamily serine protease